METLGAGRLACSCASLRNVDTYSIASPNRVVEVRQGSDLADPKCYYVFVRGEEVYRSRVRTAAVGRYRELMATLDPPPPASVLTEEERRKAVADEMAREYFRTFNPAKGGTESGGRIAKRRKH